MFEKLRIKQQMEVTDQSGKHVGTVDNVDGDRMKLTRSNISDGAYHFIALDQVDKIAGNRVYLKDSVAIPVGA